MVCGLLPADSEAIMRTVRVVGRATLANVNHCLKRFAATNWRRHPVKSLARYPSRQQELGLGLADVCRDRASTLGDLPLRLRWFTSTYHPADTEGCALAQTIPFLDTNERRLMGS